MKNWTSIHGFVCVIGLLGCAEADAATDAGACQNVPDCNCNDGRKGTKVCDVESGEFVMCLCGAKWHAAKDAGAPAEDASSPTQPVAASANGLAGRSAANQAGGPAAGSGSPAGAAADAPKTPSATAAEQPAMGGAAADHPGKGAEKKRGNGPKGG